MASPLKVRRDTAALAEMSWPRIGRNRWFDKRWAEQPPDTRGARTPDPARGQDAIGDNQSTEGLQDNTDRRERARIEAEALFKVPA